MPENQNSVLVSDLTKSFGGFTAVDQVNFSIPKGEIFGLLGPNGAGKTTTIRMLCGILKPTSGQGSVLGFDISKKPEEIKKRIGYMSQHFSLYNDLTAQENIQFYTSIYGVPRAIRKNRIEELIETSGLKDHYNELTKNLSGAWRQRLALACAIAHNPPMLFLDESTAGVDPVSRREFWDLIYDLAGKDVSVLATTHYMDEAEYCNKVGMMYQGKLIANASPDELKDALPGSLFQLDCDKPVEAERLLDGMPEVVDSSVHGVLVHVVVRRKKDKNKVVSLLENNGIEVDRMEEIEPSLEDVFITMVESSRRVGQAQEKTLLPGVFSEQGE
ncbi:MAG: ABC transporter ATP-binding protein [Anaerolineales bacterium]|nr:ABC transporter ATP-binding protein [Anaerolineales bacterium]